MKLSKTNYLIYRDCGKNAWLKIHKPDVYFENTLSAFEEGIIETGNEVDILARKLFPEGVLVENRRDFDYTKKLIEDRTPIIYQPAFETDKYTIAGDIIVWNAETEKYDLYEVKASNSGEDKGAKNKLYVRDIAFQYIVMKDLGIPVGKLYLTRLNVDYVFDHELDIQDLFTKEDFTDAVLTVEEEVREEMQSAYDFLQDKKEPTGNCSCYTKGRNSHCTTFKYSNPKVPAYSVHDISRIGLSKRKLEDLVDSDILDIQDVPSDYELDGKPLSDKQRNQIITAQTGREIWDNEGLEEFLDTIEYPIAFLDYETFPSAIPRFKGYKPYNQIPFQFSLHVLDKEGGEYKHSEFLYSEKNNPDEFFIKALEEQLPDRGSIIAWHQSFEKGINTKLAERNPEYAKFLEAINDRFVDLEDPFKNQFLVMKEFKGKTSIKYILPAVAPELSYKDLAIQEGGTASNTWNQIVTGGFEPDEIGEKLEALLKYCQLDTWAMVRIWEYLKKNK